MPTITDRRTEGLDSEMEQMAIGLTQPADRIRLASMPAVVKAAPAQAAPAQQPQSLDALYARLDQTAPGSESSRSLVCS